MRLSAAWAGVERRVAVRVGEFVGAQAGLGYLILQRNFSMDAAGMFAILIVLSIIGIVLHGIVKFIAQRVIFWADAFSDLSRGT